MIDQWTTHRYARIIEWLNTNAGAVQALSTLALLAMTALYVWFTKSLAAEARRSQRPYVHFDIDARGGTDLQMILGNSGDRAANDIEVKVVDRQTPHGLNLLRRHAVPERKLNLQPLRDLPPVRSGVRYLAPGRVYRWDLLELGRIDDLLAGAPGEHVIEVEISYHGGGERFHESTLFDFAVFGGLRVQTFADPLGDMAGHLQKIGRTLDRQKPTERGFPPMKACPFCSSQVVYSAAKCAACREWLIPTLERLRRRARNELKAGEKPRA
jgi:hypothetical protein